MDAEILPYGGAIFVDMSQVDIEELVTPLRPGAIVLVRKLERHEYDYGCVAGMISDAA